MDNIPQCGYEGNKGKQHIYITHGYLESGADLLILKNVNSQDKARHEQKEIKQESNKVSHYFSKLSSSLAQKIYKKINGHMLIGPYGNVHTDKGDPDHDITNQFLGPTDPYAEDIPRDHVPKGDQHGQDDADSNRGVFNSDECVIKLFHDLTPPCQKNGGGDRCPSPILRLPFYFNFSISATTRLK